MTELHVNIFDEANRWVEAVCTCGFVIEGRLLRVFFETGYPCRKCGTLGGYTLYDKDEENPTEEEEKDD